MPASQNRSVNRSALLGDSYPLRDGFRVRLRMARSSDAVPIRGLLDRVDFAAGDLELARLVQFDPRRRCVICATALIDATETLVGVGAIELDTDGQAEPDMLVVSEEHAEAVAELLTSALIDRVAYAARARAA
jgi:hypothetical protein